MHSRPRCLRTAPLATALVVGGAAATAGAATASTPAGPDAFMQEATAFCTALVNDNSTSGRAAAFVAGEDAWLEMLPVLVQGDDPSEFDFGTIGEAVAHQRDAIAATTDAIEDFSADTEPTAAQADAWAAIVTAGRELADFYGRRADLLATEDAAQIQARWEPLGDAGEFADDAFDELGGEQRDCARMLSFRLLPGEPTPFYLDAATTCSALANEQLERRVLDDTDAVLGAMADLYSGDLDPADWPMAERPVAAATRLAEYADFATQELADVTDDGLDDADAWSTVLESFRAAARRYYERASAMSDDDAEAIAMTMAPGYGEADYGDGFTPWGLDQRDCQVLWH